MVNLDIKWDDPKQIKTPEGFKWKRKWLIPLEYSFGFWNFWKFNKFHLKSRGFGVEKINDIWYLIETRDSKNSFVDLIPKNKNSVEKEIEEDFWLPPYEVKDISGLRPWQVTAVGKLCSSIEKWGCAIDGSDLGIGKTYTACGVARELNMDIAVICPKSVMESWRRVICNHFNMKDKLRGIINYEQVKIGKKESPFASYIKNKKSKKEEFTWKLPKNTLIIWDESQKLKNWKTKNSKTCIHALKNGYKMLFCSATAATNPLELRTVGTCIQLFQKGNNAYYNWAYAHGVIKGRFGLEFVKNDKALKKLHRDIFENRGVRLKRDTIPNFPESEIIAECYNMDELSVSNINSIYDEMKKELKKLESNIKRDKAGELTAILRARQRCELEKIPLFIDMIEDGIENDMSVVVFLNFTETIKALSERLKTICIFDGKTKDEIRQKNVDDFQDDKERIILVNIQSGGAGLNLQDIHGKYPRLSLISPSFSAVLMRQATGRVWRDSSKTKSIQKIIFVGGTAEEKVCENVREKLHNMDLLNDGDLSVINENEKKYFE
jgi:superfamily II DNA or RNA helicase